MFAEDMNAFPTFEWLGGEGREVQHPVHGMSLRDYLAAASLTGILGNHDYMEALSEISREQGTHIGRQVSLTAYSFADDMLLAREKPF